MHATTALRLATTNERIARAHRDAAQARLAEEARHRLRLTLRQRAGRLLMAAGRRLAAEPIPRLARSA
jgi:hypothetical protein